MENSAFDVAYVARLARLQLTAAETEKFQQQLEQVLQYADKLREVNVSEITIDGPTTPNSNVVRQDEARPWFTTEEALSNAPRQANGLFMVTKVVE